MNQEMAGNLQDLRDIRRQMDSYYGIGQEYFRQKQLYQRYEKSKEKWAPKNKLKYILISIIAGCFFGAIGRPIGIAVAIGLFFFYGPISNSKMRPETGGIKCNPGTVSGGVWTGGRKM